MTFEEWKVKQTSKGPARYTHFDYKIDISRCLSYITNPCKVEHHAFYPFIHFEKKSRKIKDGHKAPPKIRDIYYASHTDGWIYKYYSYLLNLLYNAKLKTDGIDSVAVAYRTDLGKSNIHLAHDAFEFIRKVSPSFVMIGDFTDFFDSLDHIYLKKRLCELLERENLPADYYAVFKSVTKFHFMELNDLLAYHNFSDRKSDVKEFNSLKRALSPEELRINKSKILANKNSSFGVPQGSPISAVFANIYMLEADKSINSIVASRGGLYMRYSDDFIIVLPTESKSAFVAVYDQILEIINSTPRLQLQGKKTKLFKVDNNNVQTITSELIPESTDKKNIIDFLGFSFDGRSVTIRDKTLFKFYNRMYRKAKTIVRNGGVSPKGKKISCKNLYERYSYKGSLGYKIRLAKRMHTSVNAKKRSGNFLDYVSRAKREFKGDPIDRSTQNHMSKIRRHLKPPVE